MRQRRAADPEAAKARSREESKRWYWNNVEVARAKTRRRKALARGAPVAERFTHREIAERDDWKCHICGGKVTQSEWSIDHLVPVSFGGPHTRQNVALAHFGCNSRRKDGRLPAQLLLFG